MVEICGYLNVDKKRGKMCTNGEIKHNHMHFFSFGYDYMHDYMLIIDVVFLSQHTIKIFQHIW